MGSRGEGECGGWGREGVWRGAMGRLGGRYGSGLKKWDQEGKW